MASFALNRIRVTFLVSSVVLWFGFGLGDSRLSKNPEFGHDVSIV